MRWSKAKLGAYLFLGWAMMPCRVAGAQASPAFEVASVKLNKTTLPPMELRWTPARFVAQAQTVRRLIMWAYGTETLGPLGAPAWINEDLYDIEATAAPAATEQECRLMLQNLLSVRFKLRAHWESRDTPIYALVQLPTGLKMKAVEESDKPGGVNFVMDGRAMPMFDRTLSGWTIEQLALALSAAGLDRPVFDRTGLRGRYSFTLEFRHRESEPDSPDITAAVQRQLGLKLEARNEKTPRLVVDAIERPEPN